MKTVIDTSAIIAFLREVKPGDQVARLLESNQAVIPSVCVFELLAGVKSPVHIHQRLWSHSRHCVQKEKPLITKI